MSSVIVPSQFHPVDQKKLAEVKVEVINCTDVLVESRPILRIKPEQWTKDEYDTVTSEGGWEGSLNQLMDLIRRLGPYYKITNKAKVIYFIHFENIVLEFSPGRLDSIQIRHDDEVGLQLLFTHPDSEVVCRIFSNDDFAIKGKPVYLCTATSIQPLPYYYSDEESDNEDEYEHNMKKLMEDFATRALEKPSVLNIPLFKN